MPEYYNPWSHTVELVGPGGDRIRIKGKSIKTLNDYFDRYVVRGQIKRVDQNTISSSATQIPQPSKQIPINKINSNFVKQQAFSKNEILTKSIDNIKKTSVLSQPKTLTESSTENVLETAKKNFVETHAQQPPKNQQVVPTSSGLLRRPPTTSSILHVKQHQTKTHLNKNKIIGRQIGGDVLETYTNNSKSVPYRISNGVAICVLSYNRGDSLLRLINSIKKTVDLNQTVVFISDDNSTDPHTIAILKQLAADKMFVVMFNNNNIGISGNTNRLLRCAKRFEHIFLLNDDVQFLRPGWDQFYIQKSKQSGIQHACFRQPGVYGAKTTDSELINIRGVQTEIVYQKPHGAMLYLTNKALKICGYFNEEYKKYGMEHVDWSMKPAEFELQQKGFIDFVGSNDYMIIHSENSSVPDRGNWYKKNVGIFAARKERIYVDPSQESIVPKITYIVPCRDHERTASIKTVINGIIGQSFPEIQIILVEQDVQQKIDQNIIPTIDYLFVGDTSKGLFNKSKAFNRGALIASSDYYVLHDADMISRADYTDILYNVLQKHSVVHICGKVLYLNAETTNLTNLQNKLPTSPVFERMIGYFEGGSLAIQSNTYWKIGAFNEDYWSYGCEDCDFYARAKSQPTWLCTEDFDLVHLWHSRVSGWEDHHARNKTIEARLALLSIEERIELQIRQLKSLGYGHKL